MKILKKTLQYYVPIENLYNFLLDFSDIIPVPKMTKSEDSDEENYTLQTSFGDLTFKIIKKEINKQIIYHYDFSKSDVKAVGELSLNFTEITEGKVKLDIVDQMHVLPESESYYNWIGTYLEIWINHNMGKIIAKIVQTVFYQKSFEDMTIRNHKLLKEKIESMGKKVDDLKEMFFEVKAPLIINSFNCAECGAFLNITSKDEKFIICEYCNTAFLMMWQHH